ncbi:MAG TPA: hypothetical protein VGH56_03675 [Solirubrobacteraceae bacterium]
MSKVITENHVRHARAATLSAAMNGAALATVALGSAVQVALYLRYFGATHRTDGLIAAFAAYSLVVVFGQLLRTTAVPLLSGARPLITGPAFGWAVVLIALIGTALCAALSHPLGHAVAEASGPQGRSTAASALLIMAPAAGLQLVGAGLAVSGATRGRLDRVAVAYMVSALAGLAGFFALRGPAADLVLAWTVLIASTVLVAVLVPGVGATVHRPQRWGEVSRATLALVRSVLLPASFVVMYPLSLALAPSSRPGEITLFGLAFTACSYLAAFTAQALSMSDVLTFARLGPGASAERQALILRAFRYSLLLAAPVLAIVATAGAPIVRALLPADSSGSHSYFGTFVLLLIPWLIATLGVWVTMPALLARFHGFGGWRLLSAVVSLIAVHVVSVLIGRAIAGFDGLVLALAVAPAVFTIVGLGIAAPGTVTRLIRPTLILVAAAAVSFAAPALALLAVAGDTPAAGVAAALIGTALYIFLARLAYPDAARTLIGLVNRS